MWSSSLGCNNLVDEEAGANYGVAVSFVRYLLAGDITASLEDIRALRCQCNSPSVAELEPRFLARSMYTAYAIAWRVYAQLVERIW